MKIKMLKGAANPKPNDFMILNIAEISKIRSENAKLREIAERVLLNCETLHPNTVKLHRAELDQLKEGAK